MVGLYDYDNATKQECIDDLLEIIEYLYNYGLSFIDPDYLEMKGLRIQFIAQRLKELGGGENDK